MGESRERGKVNTGTRLSRLGELRGEGVRGCLVESVKDAGLPLARVSGSSISVVYSFCSRTKRNIKCYIKVWLVREKLNK